MDYRITIDVRTSVSANAEDYYEEAKKARQKLVGARRALLDTQKKIADLSLKQETSSEGGPEIKKIKEKRWFDAFHHFKSSDGFFVLGGKDATTNDILIKKHLEKNDTVFHAEIHGAPLFVIKNPEGKEIPEKTISETAEAAASYSKAWKLGMGSCDVYYVKPDQVSKTAPSGEYVSKGAFMIHGKKEWMRGTILRIAIGFRVEESIEVISGPVDAVAAETKHYVKVVPGDKKSQELASSIKAIAMKSAKKEDAERIKKVNLDEVQRLIPGGKGRIMA